MHLGARLRVLVLVTAKSPENSSTLVHPLESPLWVNVLRSTKGINTCLNGVSEGHIGHESYCFGAAQQARVVRDKGRQTFVNRLLFAGEVEGNAFNYCSTENIQGLDAVFQAP